MIPKKIHYCWFGGNPLTNDIKKCIKSWERFAPGYEIIEWNESNFNVESHPFMKCAYDNKAWAFVSDYARLKIIYENGGIYLDTDVELLKPIDDLLENYFFIGIQQTNKLPTTGLGYGAIKGHPIIKEMMDQYDLVEYTETNRREIACPYLNSKVLFNHGYVFTDDVWEKDGIKVFPGRFFDPIAQGDTANLLGTDTYSIHHYSGSWTSKVNIIKQKMFRFIGPKNVYKIKKILGKAK